MRILKRFLLLGTLVTCMGAASASAQMPPAANIVGVTATTGVAVVSSGINQPERVRLPKFAPSGHAIPQAVLVVDWQTVRALPAGAVVRFSYRRPNADLVRNLDHRYGQAVTGSQQTRFAVNLVDPKRDRVAAWRVQILYQDQVLDEQHSASWR